MTQAKARGHMLLVAIVLATLLTLLLAMTMIPINTANTRAREQELLYRGEHLAQGIRRYYAKFGRFPFDLEELVEQEPRFVRKVYKDPMTPEGEWNLVYLTPEDQTAVKGLNRALNRALGAQAQAEGETPAEGEKGEGTELNSENVAERTDSLFTASRRQITGLRSKSDKQGLTVRDDSAIYSDWLFTALPKKDINLEDISRQLDRREGGKGP